VAAGGRHQRPAAHVNAGEGQVCSHGLAPMGWV
jgi:hypothetical protein